MQLYRSYVWRTYEEEKVKEDTLLKLKIVK